MGDALLEGIESGQDELISLCCRLIQAPSENPPGDCSMVNDVLEEFLGRNGIETRRYTSPGGRESLVAVISGSRVNNEGGLVLCGHSDVVSAGDPDLWSFPPFIGDVKDGFIRGRGASDMKCGLAGLAFVVGLLGGHRHEVAKTITLAVVADEETGGAEGAEWLLGQRLVKGEACLIGEPASPDYPTIGQKGACWFEVHIKGLSAHGSLSPLAGRNAIVLASRAALALQHLWELRSSPPQELEELIAVSAEHAGEEHYSEVFRRVSVNVGTISGGTKINMVPDRCVISVDTRVPFGLEPKDVLSRAEELLVNEAGLAKEDFEITPVGFRSTPNYTAPSEPVVRHLLGAIREVRGTKPRGVLQWASSDARHFRAYGIPAAQYGPAYLPSIHGVDERVRVQDVIESAKVYALFVSQFMM